MKRESTLVAMVAVAIFSVASVKANASNLAGATVMLPNPAVVNCQLLGGTPEVVKSTAGEDSNCVIEEFTLFDAMFARGLIKFHNHQSPDGAIGMGNPASENCLDVGGVSKVVKDLQGNEIGLCVVPVWTLIKSIDLTNEPAF
jgi:putative hemolysin